MKRSNRQRRAARLLVGHRPRFLALIPLVVTTVVSHAQQWQEYATGEADGTVFYADVGSIQRSGSAAQMWTLAILPRPSTFAGYAHQSLRTLYYYRCETKTFDSDITLYYGTQGNVVYQTPSKAVRDWVLVPNSSVASAALKIACGGAEVAPSALVPLDKGGDFVIELDPTSIKFEGTRFEAVTLATYEPKRNDTVSGRTYSAMGTRVAGDCATSSLRTLFRRLFNAGDVVRELKEEPPDKLAQFDQGTVGFQLLKKVCEPLGYQVVARPDNAQPKASAGKGSGSVTGSAFLVSSSGHLLTNAHVVEACSEVLATGPDGREQRGLVTARDERNDLAIVKVPSAAGQPLSFRQTPVRSGEQVVALGFPLRGLLASEVNVSTGTVSALAGIKNDTSKLQIQAPVQPGNSGGPLMDLAGAAIGVVVEKLDALAVAKVSGDIPQNVNFAVKGELAVLFLRSAGIVPKLSPPGVRLDAPEVAMRGRPATYLLECKR